MHDRYVLGCDEKIIGPVDVAGHDGALQATKRMGAGNLVSIPDVRLTPRSRQVAEWFEGWRVAGDRRDLLIRDNQTNRWIWVTETMIRSSSASSYTVWTEAVHLREEPAWWLAAL